MDYLVLARKLRPARFADLIGQDNVVRILRNAMRQDRVAHAFLFAGARGVGKTSAARILTKLWNCLDPRDAEPCNACANCVEIAANASPDVYEIDAASNRGIDNIRELRENIKFAPAKCRYKTYIIDEVHMLTTESFNALLKTLEEPPAHVKFILATTSPHKIPETILSRCQRFDFSRIPVGAMVDYMARAAEQEGIAISRRSLEAIARNAAGGMRDALTMLDQVVAFSGKQVPDDQVHAILGLMDSQAVLTLLGAILDRDLNAALGALGAIVAHGHDLQALLERLLREIKDLSLFAALGGQDPYFQDHPPDTVAFLSERAPAVSTDIAQQLFYLFLELEGQLKRSQFAQACFEMALVKACQVQSLVGVPELLNEVRSLMAGEPGAAPRAAGAGRGAPPEAAESAAPAPGRARTGPGANPFVRPERPAARVRAPEEPEPEAPAAKALAPHPAAPEVEPELRAPATPVRSEPPEPRDAAEPAARVPAEPPEPKAAAVPAPAVAQSGGDTLEEDPRWARFIARVQEMGKVKLASQLKRSQALRMAGLGGDAVEVIPADQFAREALLAEAEWLAPPFAEAFGAGSRIVVNRDKNRTADAERSLLGRREAELRARQERIRRDALQDEAVRRVQRFFPGGKVASVVLPDPSSD